MRSTAPSGAAPATTARITALRGEFSARQRMLPLFQRKNHALPAQRRVIDRHHHLDRPGAVMTAAFRLAILRDGVEPIAHWAGIVRRRGIHQRSIERFPSVCLAFGFPRGGTANENVWGDIAVDARNRFAAVQLDAPMPDRLAQLGVARERGIHPVCKLELREYLVAGDVSDVVLHDAAVAGGYVVPLPKHAGGAPEWIAEEQAHQVEQV